MKRLVVLTVALVFAVAAGAAAGQKPTGKTKTTNGVVKSVSGSSLTITSGKNDMTFDIDNSTKVVAKGAGTKAAAAKQEGKGLAITDAVKEKDQVTVVYHDMGGGKMHAASVRVRK
ncbi:MAG TPA: hypothetical protein VEK56_18135 [Vicinamibacterales bacterium]|nr:hypothetical protein [Vicinamibacterales bacterium]